MNTSGSYPTSATSTETKYGTSGETVTLANLKKTDSTYSVTNGIGYKEGKVGTSVVTTTVPASNSVTTIKLYYERYYGTLKTAKGSNIASVTEQNTVTYYYGATVPALTATCSTATGYSITFDKWTSSNTTYIANKTTATIASFTWPAMPKGTAITLTASANKTAVSYKVTYNYNGATGGNTDTSKNVAYNSAYGTLPSPSRSYTVTYNANNGSVSPTSKTVSYTFGGWYKETAFTNQVTATTTMNTAAAHNIYAKWTGGTTTHPTPTRADYDFDGWYTSTTGGTKITNSTVITSSQTVYAHWKEQPNGLPKTDSNGDSYTLPKGAEYVEGTVNTGLVIRYKGSEFVWIPVNSDLTVKGTTKLMAKESTGSYAGSDANGRLNYEGVYYKSNLEVQTLYSQGSGACCEPSLITEDSSTVSGKGYDLIKQLITGMSGKTNEKIKSDFEKQMQEEYNAMIESVITYGGFYVGRYETSLNGSTVASKNGVAPLSAASNKGNTWYGLYQKQKDFTTDSDSVQSSMIWQSQWYAMLNWALGTGTTTGAHVTQTGYATYQTAVKNTGATSTDVINRIYDLEGNMAEFTLGVGNSQNRALIAGSTGGTTRSYPATLSGTSPSNTDIYKGSRMSLYIKVDIEDEHNGSKPYLPSSSYSFSTVAGEKTIKDGLVMKDTDGNEYVWIEVPSTYLDSTITNGPNYSSVTGPTDYNNIETALRNWVSDIITIGTNSSSKSKTTYGHTDTWYDGCGLTSANYTNYKQKMLSSIYKNGGFWIGRYESGLTSARGSNASISGLKPLSKKNLYPINYITCSEAQQLSVTLNNIGSYNSTLMFGIQWDLVLKHLNNYGLYAMELTSDSSYWGNYCNKQFEINRGQYAYANPWNSYISYTTATSGKVSLTNGKYMKIGMVQSNRIILTTGAADNNCKKNIYDLAGNLGEWTIEQASNSSRPCTWRGGYSGQKGSEFPASARNQYATSNNYSDLRYESFYLLKK